MPGVDPTTLTSRLQQLQSGQETAWGTAVAATARWMGIAPYPSFKPYIKSQLYDEDRGSLQNAFVNSVLMNGGEYNINWQYASFEDINFALQNVLKAVSPTGVNPYVYTYAAPTTSPNALLPYTLEYGYNITTGQYAGCLGQKLTIKGEAKKQWELSMSGFFKTYTPNVAVSIVSSTNASPIEITLGSDPFVTGNQIFITGHLVNTAANGTWTIVRTGSGTYTLTGSTGNGIGGASGTATKVQTPALADRTINPIIFPGTTLYMESAGGTPGSTIFSNTFLGFTLDIENNVQPLWTGDSLTPSLYAYDKLKATLSLKLIYNQQVKTWLDTTLLAGTGTVVQIKKTSSSKYAEIDFSGALADDVSRWGDESGAQMVEVKLESLYDTGALANSLKVIVQNAVSALP